MEATTVSDGVTTFRIDRPERRNALDAATLEALLDALRGAERRGDAALVVTGGPVHFSSGGDVSSMPTAADGLQGAAGRLRLVHEVIQAFTGSDVLVVAAVEGYAIGAAWGVVLACDLVVAADDAWFAAPFAARGLAADASTAYHLPRRLGHQRAARHLYLGERLTAPDAHAAGLVSHLSPAGLATDTAAELAGRLAGGARETNALTKSLATRGRTGELADFLTAERTAVALAGHGAESREGRAAFLERREPSFR
ncbi:enoyl-CoA hydratase/isomerase family protein [Nocardioides sp. C4-1]|uniref:enoyl-CoA hydratase/isomerase family protein n=1 Tax=Nocardioides sp. C4-1 TaxID=3151851 RepID=UPI0032643B17